MHIIELNAPKKMWIRDGFLGPSLRHEGVALHGQSGLAARAIQGHGEEVSLHGRQMPQVRSDLATEAL